MLRLTIVLLVIAQIAFAQSKVTVEKYPIHEVNTDLEEDLPSYFPIVHTGIIDADGKINGNLQRRYLGRTINSQSIKEIRESYSAMGDQVYDYSTEIHDRFLVVKISRHQRNNAMSLNGYEEYSSTLFDLRTGKEFSPLALFSDEGALLFLGKAIPAFRKEYNTVLSGYIPGFATMKRAKQAEACDCECEGYLESAFRDNIINFSFAETSIGLSMNGCSWQNPGPHDIYNFWISKSEVIPWLSDFGKYMLDNGKEASAPLRKGLLFHGVLGESINTTFILTRSGTGELNGYEIYHSVGATIPLKGKVVGTTVTFDEVSPQGKAVAGFTVELKDGNMSGTWTKSDKSKTLSFTAKPYQLP